MFQQIDLSEKVSSDAAMKFAAKEGRQYAVSIIDRTYVFAVKSYFMNQQKTADNKNILGTALASNELMTILGNPAVHYYIPIVNYPLTQQFVKDGYGVDPKTGLFTANFEYFKLGPGNYAKFQDINNTFADITDIDIAVSVEKGKEMFQTYNLIPLTSVKTSKWKTDEAFYENAQMFKNFFKSVLPTIVGEVFTPQEINDYLTGKRKADEIHASRKGASNEVVSTTTEKLPGASPQLSITSSTVEPNLDDLKI